jgi:hypothetical protein
MGSVGECRLKSCGQVELFVDHLVEVFTPHDNTLDPEVERELAAHTQHSENIQAFTLSKFKQVIKQLIPLKAPGSDLITARMIQETPPEGLHTPLYIFNSITSLEYWPVSLKHANIIMISKPEKTTLTSHHIDQSVRRLKRRWTFDEIH